MDSLDSIFSSQEKLQAYDMLLTIFNEKQPIYSYNEYTKLYEYLNKIKESKIVRLTYYNNIHNITEVFQIIMDLSSDAWIVDQLTILSSNGPNENLSDDQQPYDRKDIWPYQIYQKLESLEMEDESSKATKSNPYMEIWDVSLKYIHINVKLMMEAFKVLIS